MPRGRAKEFEISRRLQGEEINSLPRREHTRRSGVLTEVVDGLRYFHYRPPSRDVVLRFALLSSRMQAMVFWAVNLMKVAMLLAFHDWSSRLMLIYGMATYVTIMRIIMLKIRVIKEV